ncbi:RNA polymerase sigma factor [Diaminobutyricimonas sp. LJ205]|uniref:RNA polymerase sigma factor n=1 Tax=Diaminobutyricimonas sp. LJ205 TaxID=2683590 RepID=UPI0012F50B77|nr:RNA polymerase sigma factor [Diaminobutyricimonas sp. LJ205]
MTASTTHGAVEAVWRIESARVVGALVRMVGDVALAEDLAQDALVAALEQWPRDGVPKNPGAWLTAIAKRRAIDTWRRQASLENKYALLADALERSENLGEPEQALAAVIDDDVLRLVFVACHPVLPKPARVALTLKLVGGLSTEEIARAFLVPTPTIAQRIVRAKRALTAAHVPFEVPDHTEFTGRLSSVLEVIYLIFNEGYSATSGDDWMRPGMCDEALRLGRMLAELVPREPEVHGLVALMELQASRLGARTSRDGEPVLLADQDRTRWNRLLIGRGLAALARTDELAASTSGKARGPYTLQAALAACHATAPSIEQTDWARIVALYEELGTLTPSPVIELNRAVAVSMLRGPAAALEIVDALREHTALRGYHLLPTVRADLLAKVGRTDEARHEFERAAELTDNAREKALLLARAQQFSGRS